MTPKPRRCHGITRSGSRCKKDASGGAFCQHHPLKGGLTTKYGFAQLEGVEPSMVSNWLNDGVIGETDEGRIAWELAHEQIEATRDPSKARRRSREPQPILDESTLPPAIDDADRSSWSPAEWDLLKKVSKAQREEARAAKEQMERAEMEARLIDSDDVRRDVQDIFTTVRQRLMTMPSRLANRLAAMSSKRDCFDLIDEEVRRVLNEAADDVDDRFDAKRSADRAAE